MKKSKKSKFQNSTTPKSKKRDQLYDFIVKYDSKQKESVMAEFAKKANIEQRKMINKYLDI